MTVYSQRRRKLLALAKGKQVVALTAPNLFYLTDFFGAAAAIVHSDKTVVLTSPLEADRAEEVCREAEIVVVRKWREVKRTLKKLLGDGRTLVDSDELRLGSSFIVNRDFFLEARRIKDETEIERIREACAKTNRVFEAVESELKPGRTEWQLAAEAMKVATEQGMSPSSSDSSLGPIIIASGPHGAYGHSELSGRRVKNGDFVVVDLFFRFQGYNSDETRTFAVGTIDAEMKKHYSVVREAQGAALVAATEGTRCGAVNDAAVEVLRKHGMDKLLNHSVGHGVGIDIHELPGIHRGNRVKLTKNDVITDEPGVYLVGKYGIRIEDTLVVGRKQEVLTKFTKDLVTCG